MENQVNEIITDKMYLSEVFSELPGYTILNKGVTGCGGTYLELHTKRNSIILVPTIELAKNKAEKDFLVVYGKVEDFEIKKYINSSLEYKKIIGTYDSLKRLLAFPVLDYFLLIDEYHIFFNAYSFRNDTITFVLKNYHLFKSYCFMTATPLDSNIILEEIKHLPQLSVKWTKAQNIKLNLIDCSFTTKEVIKLINSAAEENLNYHIFVNSVQTIKTIVEKAKLTNYKVVCSEKSSNTNRTLNIGSTLDKVKKYNFYTSTAFEGCDIFDPIGKTVILCDTSIATTILDISTLIRQICGRLRNSIYKEDITLILNTTKHRYANISKEMFALKVQENIKLGKYIEDKFKNDLDGEKYKIKELKTYDAETYNSLYVNKYKNEIYYDDNFRKVDEYNYKLVSEIYNNSISVMKEIENNDMIVTSEKEKNWIEKLLTKKEYSLSELEEIFKDKFEQLGITFSGYIIKDYFPPFEKTRKTRNKIKETYYKFNI